MKLVTGNSNRALAEAIANYLDLPWPIARSSASPTRKSTFNFMRTSAARTCISSSQQARLLTAISWSC